MLTPPSAAVVVFPGSHGHRDLFEALALAGFAPHYHPAAEPLRKDLALVGLPGGFAYGDYWRAGVLASRAAAVRDLPDFVAQGGLVLGICNGFQILIEGGLLPGALCVNDPPGFVHRFDEIVVTSAAARSPWFVEQKVGTRLRWPIAHGQGRYVHCDAPANFLDRVPLLYRQNPNGSLLNTAALLDETGRVLGVMPHPERAIDSLLGSTDGLPLFQAAYRYCIAQAALAHRPAVVAMANCRLQVFLPAVDLQAIEAALLRKPNLAEQAVFAGMWSEHCSYRSTRHLLKTLPQSGSALLAGPGAHAGVVQVGDGWAVAFKIESHNHPSAIEPYEGAATGVGGILRDIVAAGARPCALLDSLCFGGAPDPIDPINGEFRPERRLVDGIIAGIAGYGNSIGIPNVGGRTVFDARYTQSPLVNVLAAGLLRPGKLRSARAHGPGNAVLYVGAATGRDGLLGAAFASNPLDHGASSLRSEKRLYVQVGDPFAGQRLMNACLSFDADLGLIANQDLGACGLACAASEMAALGEVGIELCLDAIPLREPDLEAVEILLSESQERFLFIVQSGYEQAALAHFGRHGVFAAVIGRITSDGLLRARHRGLSWVELPARLLTSAPPSHWPVAQDLPPPIELPPFAPPFSLGHELLRLLADKDIADQSALYDRFDHTVGNRTVRGPQQATAAVLRLPDSRRGFALTLTGRGAYCAVDPYLGTQAAVAEALRDLACAGASMIAISDGLNAGSPRDPLEHLRLVRVISGLGDAARQLNVPISGGNVSLYNESPIGAIPPTPMVGAIGVIDDLGAVPAAALGSGQDLCLLGDLHSQPVYSRYSANRSAMPTAGRVHVDLEAEKRLAALLVQQAPLVRAAQGTGLGGLLVALSKLCMRGQCGAKVTLPLIPRPDWSLFGEYAAQAWVAMNKEDTAAFSAAAAKAGTPCFLAGRAESDRLQVYAGAELLVDVPLTILFSAWKDRI